MEVWVVIAIVIVLGALTMDRTRAYRALPFVLSRLRRRSRATGPRQTLRVDSAELDPVPIGGSDSAAREKEPRHGEGH
jgi:hypothetical protein